MSDYSFEISRLYDSVPLYATRPDVQFYVEEARSAGGNVLEIGCGTGRVLIPTARAGLTIDGVDTASGMISVCAERVASEPQAVRDRVALHESDGRHLDLRKSFRLVTAPFRVMQHQITIDDQLEFLASVKRHLGRDGRFVFDVFNPDFAALVSADGIEREDTPPTSLPDGRSFRRAARVKRVRFVEQVSEVEVIYYVTASGEPEKRFVQGFDMRWYLRDELVHLLARAGLRVRSMYGDFDRSPLADTSKEIIVVTELA